LLPQLASHPQSVTNIIGTEAQFNVTAVGPPPLAYQWLKNGQSLSGQTGATLSISGTTVNDNGNYAVVVSNQYGAVTSAVAVLAVYSPAPTILSQPQDLTRYEGNTAVFSVSATGLGPLTYQWFKDGAPIPGAADSIYSASDVQVSQSGHAYSVRVSNSAGTVQSAKAFLTVRAVGDPKLTFSSIVAGISRIWSEGAPGPVIALATNWVTIAAGAETTSIPSTFVLARDYHAGRVAIVGHDGLFTDDSIVQLDNALFDVNLIRWLNGGGKGKVFSSSGHSEWLGIGKMNILGSHLLTNGFELASTSAPLSSSSLALASVLIVGNAWGSFTPDEIEAVRQFVTNGGGLLLSGLGWSWPAYHAGSTLDDYPMTKMGAPYQAEWLEGYISDPSNQLSGSPIFHTLYPNATMPNPVIRRITILDGAVSLLVNVETGRQYRLQTSANLADFLDVTNIVSTTPTWSVADRLGQNEPHRFYRVASP
jgi:hypothetical protein